jgi:AcrR family transcriptional regulator
MKLRMTSEERRAAIVQSAIRLFAEKGFRGATTREIASAVGVTEPVLYQHFRTKHDLYSAIIEARSGEAAERVTELRELAARGDDRAFFSRLGELILERYESDPATTRLLLVSCLEKHELSELFFERLVEQFYSLVSAYIRRRMSEGAFRRVDPDIAARGVIGMMAYQGLMGLLFPENMKKVDRRKVVRGAVSIFLEGIQAPKQT